MGRCQRCLPYLAGAELTGAEAKQVANLLSAISRPFIDQEVLLALRSHGRLVYDGGLTGHSVSSTSTNTSTTYPGAAYGHMSDSVQLGYQAAMVSMHSPTYGRLWLGVTPHPGNTLSFGQGLRKRWCGRLKPKPAYDHCGGSSS